MILHILMPNSSKVNRLMVMFDLITVNSSMSIGEVILYKYIYIYFSGRQCGWFYLL